MNSTLANTPEAPATLPFHPAPIETFAVRHWNASGWVTAIFRRWSEGSAARCQLCPRGTCSADGDRCIVAVDGFVPQGEAALHSTAETPGFTWRDEAGAGSVR